MGRRYKGGGAYFGPKLTKMKATTGTESFTALDIRVGTIASAQVFEGARRPAYVLLIDFGDELGTLKSSAQITVHYSPESLAGRQVVAVVNFPSKQIGNLQSQCLVLGAVDGSGGVILLEPERSVPNGTAIA